MYCTYRPIEPIKLLCQCVSRLIVFLSKMLSIGRHFSKSRSCLCLINNQKIESTHKQLRYFTSYLLDIKDGPSPALVLGAAGLIPFVSAPVALMYNDVSSVDGFIPLIAQGMPLDIICWGGGLEYYCQDLCQGITQR